MKRCMVVMVVLICIASAFAQTGNKSYSELTKKIRTVQDSFAVEYAKADGLKRASIVKSSREFVFNTIVNDVFPHWYGTEWDFYGTTTVPKQGVIACGYFVTTVLYHSGFNIPYVKWAQLAATPMIKKISSDIKKFANRPIEEVKSYIKEKDDGLYVIGLDFHVGFIYKCGDSIKFVHSNYKQPEIGVMSQDFEVDGPLNRTEVRVIGRILDDKMMVKWLKKEKFVSDTPSILSNERSKQAIGRVKPNLEKNLTEKSLSYGAPIYIRIFKEEKELELWVKKDEGFVLFKTYPVHTYGSQGLGPKLRQGDGKAPEGFYFVTPDKLNPSSDYHLAFNVGYPNGYDSHHGRTGSAIMVHGNEVSIGCFAMTDPLIEEIYALADGAFRNGQSFFRVHIFPFRMTDESLEKQKDSEWFDFWKNLKEGYDKFAEYGNNPPNIQVSAGKYVFNRE